MNQNIEFKAIPGQFNIDEAQGIVECFVAGIGNKDSVGDVLVSGAFSKSLTRRKPRVVWGHNWNDPIGKVLEIYEVAPGDRRLPMKMLNAGIGGLYARVQFNLNSEKGREAFANVAFFGQEQEWSIGYKTLDSIFDPNIQANILKEVELYEVSPVLHGANQLTGTISVKSDEMVDDSKGGIMAMGMTRPMGGGPNIPHRHHRPTPNILEANKPGIGDERKNQLEIELALRAGAPVKVRLAEENTVIFDRMTPDGAPTTYRVSYHFTGREFMFGKPEKVSVQTVYVPSSEESGSRVVVPSQMPSMPMQVKPQGNAYMGDDQNEYQGIMPKSYDDGEKWVFDDELADLANIISDSLDVKVGRALSSKNMSKLKAILENLQDVIASAEKDVESKSDYVIPVAIENAFETKQLLDPIFDYHRVESHVTEDGIVVTSGVTQEFVEALGVAEKALGQRLGGGLGKLGRAARGAANFDPKAWDGDGDGLVQEGTPYQRPAIPGVNDRATGGRVDVGAATRAFRQQTEKPGSSDSKKPSSSKPSSKKPSARGLASRGRPDPIKREGEFHGGNIYDEFNGAYVEGEVIALSDLYGDDRPGYAVVGRFDSDGTGTVDYFYGGDDEEFETIEDAIAFLENVENEAENDRFYNDENFRKLDRVRSAGRPGARPLAGLASTSYPASWQLPNSEDDKNGIRVLDSQVLSDRMAGLSLDDAAEKFGIPKEKLRKMEAREMARIREEMNPQDFVAYRMMGMSAEDLAEITGKTPAEIRQIQDKEIAKMKKNPSDTDLLQYRERGMSLDDLSEITGIKREELRKREIRTWNAKPEIPERDKPLNDAQIRQMAEDDEKKRRGLASAAEVVSKDELPKNIVNDLSNAAVRAVGDNGDETKLIDGIKEVLANLTNEKLKDSVGTSMSNARKKLAEMLSDEKIIEEFKSREAIDDFMDEVGYSVQRMLDSHLYSVKKTGTSIEKEEIEDIVDNAKSQFDDDFNKLIKASRDFWNKRRKPGRLDNTPEEAKKTAAKDRKNLMDSLREGGEPEDLESTLSSISDLWKDSSEGITSGTISLEDLNYEIEKAIDQIVENDPSIDPEELVNEFADALREGASKDGANPLIVSLAKEFGDGKITGGDLIDSLNDTRQNSVYRPDRGKIEKEKIRGLASVGDGRMRDEDNFDEYDEAFGPVARGSRRGMADDPVGDAAAENLDRDRNAGAVRRGLASTRGEGSMLARDGQIRRDERGNVDPTEAREARAAFDQNIFNKLRDLGFNDDEIEQLTGVADGGRIREGGKPAQYVPDGVGRRARTGLASESRAPGKLSENTALRRVNRAVSEDGTTVLDSQILKDFLSGMSAEEVNNKHKLGGKRFASAAANREIGRIRSNMDSQANSDMDLLIYRASGLSVGDTADLFNISPREVRKREKRIGAKLKKNTDDEDLLYLRSALSLEETGKIVGLEPIDVRRQEQAALRSRRNERGGLASASAGPDDDESLYIEDQRILDDRAYEIDEELEDMDMGPRHEEIARRLGIPVNEVKQRVERAKRRSDRSIESRQRRRGLASESREMDMTLEEYGKLNQVLSKYTDDSQASGIGADEDMQILQDIIDKIDNSSAANDAVSMTDSEIDDYIDTLTRMKDNGPVEDQGDKVEIEKLIDSLKKTKKSATGSYSSDALEEAGTRLSSPTGAASRSAKPVKNVRAFRTSSGTINPHEKLRIELSRDEIGALRDEVEMLSRTAENPSALRSLGRKLEKANNGKFTIEKDEYEDLVKSIEQSKSKGGVVSSDILGVLEQAAETSDGKFSSLNLRGGGLASTNGGKRPNNGAPPDITEAMQKEYIFWGKSANARNLRLVQEAIREYDANGGQLPASMWKRLQTMYKNMGPGSASGRGGRRGIFGRGKDKDSTPSRGVSPDLLDGTMSNNPIVTDNFVDTRSGSMGGSQGGGVFKDPNTGQEYYIKPPKTQTHAENESLMSRFYQRLGLPAGKVKVGTYKGKPKIVSEMVPGAQQVNHRSEMKNAAWKKAVQDTFVANAWLANWDATANPGNIIKGGDGKPYIIDTGGAGLFRARGERKDSSFGPIVGEMETLRKPSMNPLGDEYFRDIPPAEIARQVKEIGSISDDEIRQMVDAVISDKGEAKTLADTLIARRDYLVQNWSTGKNSGSGRRARTGLASTGEDSMGRERGPGISAGGLGDIGMRADSEGSFGVGRGGSAMTSGGGGVNQEKFEGLSLDEAKPGNWDELTNEEKFDWLMYEGAPEKVADKDKRMSQAAHEGAVKKVLRDLEREEMGSMSPAERRAARDLERENLSEGELERQRIAREKREKDKAKEKKPKTYKPAANAEEAKKKRAVDFETFKEWIQDSEIALDNIGEGEDSDPIAQDIWKTVDALLGDEDMTKRSIDDAIGALEDYLEVASEDNKYEKKSVSRAKNLLGQLEEARTKYDNDPWIVDDRPRAGLASRSTNSNRPGPNNREMPQSNAARTGEMKKIIDLAQEVIEKMKSEQDSKNGRRARVGLASSSSRPKAMITDEATFFKDIETSLQKEIRAAQKAKNKKAETGLSKLQEVIRRNEASKTGSRRTNVGSIYLTDDEADLVLEGLMFALDNQIEIGGDKRIEWYSKLLDKVSQAAMSTFINKNF